MFCCSLKIDRTENFNASLVKCQTQLSDKNKWMKR